MKIKDELITEYEAVLERYKNPRETIFKNMWNNGAFDDYDKVFALYLSQRNGTNLGDRWMAESQIRDIVNWEKKYHSLDGVISSQYSDLLTFYINNRFLYPCSYTEYGNPKEYALYKSLKNYLCSRDFINDYGNDIDRIMRDCNTLKVGLLFRK